MLERIKTWIAPALAFVASILYILLQRKRREVEDLNQTVAQHDAAALTQSARDKADASMKENTDAQTNYDNLRKQRPDIFPLRDKSDRPL